MNRSRLVEPFVIIGLSIVLLSLFAFVYRDYVVANKASWQQVTYRVMDSMLPFQERFHEERGRYTVGAFDREKDDLTLASTIDWRPSVTDTNRYVAHVIGTNAFKVIATSRDGHSLCRLYPSKQDCLDLDNYLQRGL